VVLLCSPAFDEEGPLAAGEQAAVVSTGRGWERWFTILSLVAYLAVSLLYVFAGRIHVDEGAYLYAANRVMEGELPYRDFFFLQPPVYPYVYGPLQRLLGPGLTVGRATSVLFGALSMLLGIRLASRLGGGPAAMAIAAGLIGFNTYQIYFFSITRLYALTGFWLMAAASCLTMGRIGPRARRVAAAGLLGLAVATRLTVLPALLVFVGWLLLAHGRSWRDWLAPGLVGFAVAVGGYLPFYLAAPEQFYFNILGLNLSLHSRNLAASLVQKARTISHLLRELAYPFTLLTGALALGWEGWGITAESGRPGSLGRRVWRVLRKADERAVLWSWVLTISAGHLAAKIFQESYQAILYPLLAALIAVEVTRALERLGDPELRRGVAVAVCVGSLLMAVAHGRDSLSHVQGRPAPRVLREQAALVRAHSAPGDEIFSADTALVAVEADRRVLPGMAGSDYFPDWSTEKCRRFRVTNDEILTEYITQRRAPVLIVGSASFTLSLPLLEPVPEERRRRLFRMIEENYELLAEYPNLMVPGELTRFYRRRGEP
jgi:hypothetical protein